MMRTTGILVGTLLMLGIFLLALSASNSPTLVKEVVSRESVLPAAEVPVEESADHAVPAAVDSAGLDEALRLDDRDRLLGLDPQSWNQSMGAYETASRNEPAAMSRYLVWSPFKSEWAAQGFARRLTLATDVPVEVRNDGSGNYQVVFSYRDDSERQAMVRQIETVTGLELE
jgi:hypothetical protein